MSKKYKNKNCAYCAIRASTTADHVIARSFFPEHQRNNLPKAPSCQSCNNEKSKLEHHAATDLPFGLSDVSIFTDKHARRLDNNKKLKRTLQSKKSFIYHQSNDGHIRRSTALPLDHNILEKLLWFIVKGLFWHNWRYVLPKDYLVNIYFCSNTMHSYLKQKFLTLSSSNYVQKNLGNGVFCYSSTRGVTSPFISAWDMSFFNNMKILDKRNNVIYFFAITAPKPLSDKFNSLLKK